MKMKNWCDCGSEFLLIDQSKYNNIYRCLKCCLTLRLTNDNKILSLKIEKEDLS